MTKKDIDITADIINIDKINLSDENEAKSLSVSNTYNMKEIDENLRDDSQVIKDGLSISNYKQIPLDKNFNSSLINYSQYFQQLDKFKECVRNLRYKFGIFTQDFITLIDRSNQINNYIIKSKENFIPIETTCFCISIDIENLFESVDTLIDDSIKLYSSFYGILGDAHQKQILALDSQIKLIVDVPKQIDKKKKDLSQLKDYLNNILKNLSDIYKEESKYTKLIEFEQRKKTVEQKDIKARDSNIYRLTNELQKIQSQKEKMQTSLANVRKSYHQQLLSFDFNVYKGLQLFHSMTENIKKVL